MNLEYIELSKNKRLAIWLRQRLSGMYRRDTLLWRFVVGAMWVLGCTAVALAALGMPTGFGTLFDVVTAISLNTIALGLSSAGITAILAIAGLRVPRFTVGSLIYTGVVIYFILFFSEFGIMGSVIYSVVFTSFALGLGLLIGGLAHLRPRISRGKIRWGSLLAFTLTLTIVYAASGFPRVFPTLSGMDADRAVQTDGTDDKDVHSLASTFPDPSEPGSYSYEPFTYGSGEDRHRIEFGDEVNERSSSVDASTFIKDWPWLRDKFWGFDETELPLNGRVWMPEGDGSFPLVLMLHGNHLMEKFSDEGYGYLGELLASRGIIAVSVDENFLNYSVWSGIPDQDMKTRAWVLLKHIQQLQKFSNEKGSFLYGKVNFQEITLLGHSRGGQAAAMAADRSQWFADNEGLPDADSYSVEAVVALAPTDTVIEGKLSKLEDISYLTLHGAKDSDLVNFYGDRQYGRTMFTGDTEAFKASLYIEDANHSQFNTEWGESDNALPAGLFIRPSELLEPDEQRQVAKVYVAAFLEAVLLHSEKYERLFRDYRQGLSFLPSTGYFNQYESGSFQRIADFKGADRTVPSSGVTAKATDLTDWRHLEALNRQGKGKGNNGVALEWRDEGSYTVHLSPSTNYSGQEKDNILIFSLANLVRDIEDDEEVEGAEQSQPSSLSIDIELEDRSGHAVRLPLSKFMELEQQAATSFTWLPGMESILSKGKFKDSEETVFQTYELPLDDFVDADPELDLSEWSEVTFYFNDGPGRVMLDDLGLMSE